MFSAVLLAGWLGMRTYGKTEQESVEVKDTTGLV